MWYCKHDRHQWRMLRRRGLFFHNKIPCNSSSIYNIFDSSRGNASEYHKHLLRLTLPTKNIRLWLLTTLIISQPFKSPVTSMAYHNELQKLYDTFLFMMSIDMTL